MGSLTEYFTYLNTEPKILGDTVSGFSHLGIISDEMKKTRRELKLYKIDINKKPDELELF